MLWLPGVARLRNPPPNGLYWPAFEYVGGGMKGIVLAALLFVCVCVVCACGTQATAVTSATTARRVADRGCFSLRR